MSKPEQMRDSGWRRQPMRTYPSYTRFYWGTLGLGMAVGITWTISMTTTIAQRHITKLHAIIFLYTVSILCLIAQGWMLHRWGRQLKRDEAELEKTRIILMGKKP